jgi:hypothetical protein
LLTQPLFDGVGIHWPARVEQASQRRLHTHLTLLRRQVQNPQVLLGRPLRPLLKEQVVSHAEAAAGEQVRSVTVVGERPRLAHQPVDDVPVLDAVLAPSPQSRQFLHPLLTVVDLDPLGVKSGLHSLADQPAGH